MKNLIKSARFILASAAAMTFSWYAEAQTQGFQSLDSALSTTSNTLGQWITKLLNVGSILIAIGSAVGLVINYVVNIRNNDNASKDWLKNWLITTFAVIGALQLIGLLSGNAR